MKVKVVFERLVVETRGAEIAEAAAVLPLMFMILLGIFWFGQAFSIYGAITRAVQDGARAAAVPYCATCTTASTSIANAASAVRSDLLASKLDPSSAQSPSTPPSMFSCIDRSSIPCDGSTTSFCFQVPIQLTSTSGGATGNGASPLCGVSVSIQYPFRFWMPFTSINNQTIWITSSAQVRMESQ